MKRNLIHILLFLFTGLALFSACDDENFSTDSSLKLAFSYDTLRMDTVLAGIGTSTYQLKVYNRNKESLVISSITLADAANSGFRINVDGAKGNHFSDVELRGKDSLLIFVEATLAPEDRDVPFFKKTPSCLSRMATGRMLNYKHTDKTFSLYVKRNHPGYTNQFIPPYRYL